MIYDIILIKKKEKVRHQNNLFKEIELLVFKTVLNRSIINETIEKIY